MKKTMLMLLVPTAVVLLIMAFENGRERELKQQIKALEAELVSIQSAINSGGAFSITCQTPATNAVVSYPLNDYHVAISQQNNEGYVHVTPMDSFTKSGFESTKRYKLKNTNITIDTSSAGDTLRLWVCQPVSDPLPSNRVGAQYREITMVTKVKYDSNMNRYVVTFTDTTGGGKVSKRDTVHPYNVIRIIQEDSDIKPIIGAIDLVDDDPA